jgi:hypothetical protein
MKQILPSEVDLQGGLLLDRHCERLEENDEVYSHFAGLLWDDLFEFVRKHQNKRKGQLRDHGAFHNIRVASKYSRDFNRNRKWFYSYRGKFYTYETTVDPLFPVAVIEWEEEDIIGALNEYALLRRRGLFQHLWHGLAKIWASLTK